MSDWYPPVGFHFKVTVNLSGVSNEPKESRFQEVNGLSKGLEIEEWSEGGENRFTHRLPLAAKYSNVILKRGMFTSSKLIDWCFDAIDHFSFNPVDVDIILLNEQHEAVSTWNLVNAYPVKWSVSDFKAQDNSILIESLELAFQYFTKKDN
jgi:phage tail-like protein